MSIKDKIGEIIFRHDTPAGKAFDVCLLILIVFSILLLMLETVESIGIRYATFFFYAEWIITILFTIEYVLRIYTGYDKTGYVFSFYGIVDFLSILPTYLGLFFAQSRYLTIIRALRLLRVFRIFKLSRYLDESRLLIMALKQSRPKIIVFIYSVLTVVVVIGALMYVVEPAEAGFTSIPRSMYWAIVTLTTVGYGDIAPTTPLGQFLASIVMILGYGVIAVPTGIVSSEIADVNRKRDVALNKIASEKICSACGVKNHSLGANYCDQCGSILMPS